MPGDRWQQFCDLRALLRFMFRHPGKKLLFMGSSSDRSAKCGTSIRWIGNLLKEPPAMPAFQRLVRDLNHCTAQRRLARARL